MKVLLNDINTLKEVVKVCNKYVDDVFATKGGYIVDAKSILGLLSLDLSEEIELTIDTYRDSTITNFYRDIKRCSMPEEKKESRGFYA